jgi:peptide/nickel transport system substrate-binding protein
LFGLLASTFLGGSAIAQDSSASASATSGKVVLDVGVDSDITSLNPFNLCCGPDYEVMTLMYTTAWEWNRSNLEAAPGFVQSWEHSDDYMDWTLNTVEGATFSDGQPATAEDVAFTFALIADNKMPFYKDYFPFSPTFEVLDDTTLIWHSEEPTFAPEVPAYAPILPKHIWEQFVVAGDDKATKAAAKKFENADPVGTGPFTLAEYEKGQFIRLVANDTYWGQKPKSVDEIVFHVYDNQEAMVQALKSGELDIVDGLNATLFNSLEGEPNIATHIGDGGCWGNIAWNFGGQTPKANADPVIHETAFRQAMAYSIDREEIVKKVYQDTATVGYSILMPGVNGSWVTDIPQDMRFDYDPEKAKQMLDDAGIVDTNGDGNREFQGNEIDLELLTVTDVSGSVDTGKLIQNYFKDVGISSFFTTVNTNKAYDLWFSGEWDAYVWDWCPDPDPDFMLSVFTTDQCLGWSDGCYSNPEYDKLYKLQQTQLDRTERKATIDEMQRMVAEEVPTMVLNYWSDLQAYRTDTFDESTWLLSPDDDTGLLIMGWTNASYFNIEPVGSGSATSSSSTGLPGWIWVAGIGALVVIALIVVLSRRRGRAEEA